jgi:hypothetical protein
MRAIEKAAAVFAENFDDTDLLKAREVVLAFLDELDPRELALSMSLRFIPDGTTEGDTQMDIYARRALQALRTEAGGSDKRNMRDD